MLGDRGAVRPRMVGAQERDWAEPVFPHTFLKAGLAAGSLNFVFNRLRLLHAQTQRPVLN